MNRDCRSGRCAQGRCWSCSDGWRDGDETDLDCGGSCPPCADGRACRIVADCISRVCLQGRCAGCCSFDDCQPPQHDVQCQTDGRQCNSSFCRPRDGEFCLEGRCVRGGRCDLGRYGGRRYCIPPDLPTADECGTNYADGRPCPRYQTCDRGVCK